MIRKRKMEIVGYLKTSLIEWPGQIASVIFTAGCNFRCPFCHNAELLDPEKYQKMPHYSVEEILQDLKKRKKWVDGVAVTGGEPLLQPGLVEFLKAVKKMGFGVMIESNGYLAKKVKVIDELGLVDYWGVDYKGRLDENYDLYVGLAGPGRKKIQKNEKKISTASQVLASYHHLFQSPTPLELRTTVVPDLHDEVVLRKMAQELKKIMAEKRSSKRVVWYLQSFQPKNCLDADYRCRRPYSAKQMRSFLNLIKQVYPQVSLRQN